MFGGFRLEAEGWAGRLQKSAGARARWALSPIGFWHRASSQTCALASHTSHRDLSVSVPATARHKQTVDVSPGFLYLRSNGGPIPTVQQGTPVTAPPASPRHSHTQDRKL